MLYFLLGVSITFNIVFVILAFFVYKKITPVFKSSGVDLDFYDKWSDLNV